MSKTGIPLFKRGKPLGRFIPNKPNEPQLGKLKVRKADGSIEEIPMNRKDRRASIRAELRRLRHETHKKTPQTPQQQGTETDKDG